MEQQLLQEMIVERDAKIDNLAATLQQQDDLFRTVQYDLDEVRLQHQEESLQHAQALAEEAAKCKEAQHRLGTAQAELTRVGSLRDYRACLAGDAPPPTHPNLVRVLRLQAQLCKAMHFIQVLRNELLVTKRTADQQIKALKDILTDLSDEKCKMELDLMNQLMQVDSKKRNLERDYSALVESLNLKCLELKESTHSRSKEKLLPEEENVHCDSDSHDSDSDDSVSDDDSDDESQVLDREERRKLFEKRKQDLMLKRAALSRQILPPEDRKQ